MAKGVRWDEENLETNDANRTATMKIDEPPTPFNFEYCDDEPDEAEASPKGEPSVAAATKAKGATLSFAEQWEKAGMDEIVNDPDNLKPAFESARTPEEEAEAKRKFDESRKEHYNMKEALSRKVDFEEEDDVEEEGPPTASSGEAGAEDAEAKELKRQEFARKRKAFYQEKDREAAERARLAQNMDSEEDDQGGG